MDPTSVREQERGSSGLSGINLPESQAALVSPTSWASLMVSGGSAIIFFGRLVECLVESLETIDVDAD